MLFRGDFAGERPATFDFDFGFDAGDPLPSFLPSSFLERSHIFILFARGVASSRRELSGLERFLALIDEGRRRSAVSCLVGMKPPFKRWPTMEDSVGDLLKFKVAGVG